MRHRGFQKMREKLHNYRMNYLENIITKDELKVKVQRVFKANMKLRDANQIRDMYTDTAYQLMGHLIDDVKRLRLESDKDIVTYVTTMYRRSGTNGPNIKDEKTKFMEFMELNNSKNYDKQSLLNKGSIETLFDNYLVSNQKLVDDTLQKLKELKEYAETHLEKVGVRYNSNTPHLSDWEFRDQKYKERAEQARLNKRKELGANACVNENCAYRKSLNQAYKGKCSSCFYSDERTRKENRRRELQNQGLQYTEIQRRLRDEGFSNW